MTQNHCLFIGGPAHGHFGEIPSSSNQVYAGPEPANDCYTNNYVRSDVIPIMFRFTGITEERALKLLDQLGAGVLKTGECAPEPRIEPDPAPEYDDNGFCPRSYLSGIRDFCQFMLDNDE